MRVFMVLAFLLLSFTAHAQAGEDKLLNIELAQSRVHITTGFTGSDLVLFGIKQGRGDVVVVLEGPIKQSTVRRKDRIMGAWVNRSWVNFETVPAYYDYATNLENSDKALSLALRQENRIGVDALDFDPRKVSYDEETLKTFEDAVVRLKQKRLLYSKEARRITYLDDRFFRVDFHLPANVPRGDYTVRGMLFRDGKMVDQTEKTMKVAQVGFSSDVNKVAQKHGFVYGLICVFVALMAGVLSDLLIRRS